MLAQGGERGLEILDRLVLVHALHQGHGLVPFGLGLVGDVDMGFLAPEQVGADRRVALGGKTVADVAHHLVDAENLLDHQHPGPLALLGGGEIGGKLAAIGGFDTTSAICVPLVLCPQRAILDAGMRVCHQKRYVLHGIAAMKAAARICRESLTAILRA